MTTEVNSNDKTMIIDESQLSKHPPSPFLLNRILKKIPGGPVVWLAMLSSVAAIVSMTFALSTWLVLSERIAENRNYIQLLELANKNLSESQELLQERPLPEIHYPPPPPNLNTTEYDIPIELPDPVVAIQNLTSQGSVYIHWGKTTCPSPAIPIYEGRMAGTKYLDRGGGANHLCLPMQPHFHNPVPRATHNAYIYGTHYESDISGNDLQDNAVACASCLFPHKQTAMFPGLIECPESPSDWSKVYQGYIFSSKRTDGPGNYVCVDHQATQNVVNDTTRFEHSIYVTEVRCPTNGALPCPPYVDGYELTCVVCAI